MQNKSDRPWLIRARGAVESLSIGRAASPALAAVLLMLLAVAAHSSVEADKFSLWINDLRSKDATVRARAAYAYGRLEPVTKATILRLLGGLKDDDSYVRRYCASALGETDIETNLTVPALVEALRDPDQNVREHASIALVKIGAPAVPSLVKTLKITDVAFSPSRIITNFDEAAHRRSDEAEHVVPLRAYAAFALIEIGTPAVPLLMEASVSKDEHLRNYAGYVLGEIADSAGSELAQFLNDPDRRVGLWAINNLDYPSQYAREKLPLLMQVARGKDTSFHATAVKSLGQLREHAAAAVPTLIKFLKHADGEVRDEAITALRRIGRASSDAAPHLIPLLKDPSLSVRMNVLETLGKIDNRSPEVVGALVGAASDSDLRVQDGAASALIDINADVRDVAPTLIRLVKARVTAEASERRYDRLLYKFRSAFERYSSVAIPALLEMLRDDDERLRLYAIQMFEDLSPPPGRVVSAIKPLLNDPSKQVRISAAKFVIGADDSASGVRTLVELLKDPDQRVRARAAESLGYSRRRASAAVPALVGALEDLAAGVRANALSALDLIGDESPAVVKAVVAALSDGDADVRGNAAEFIGQADKAFTDAVVQEAVAALVAAINLTAEKKADYYSADYWRFFYALSKLGPGALPALLDLLKADNENVVRHALSTISETEGGSLYTRPTVKKHLSQDERVIPALAALLDDSRPSVRRDALKALSSFKPTPPIISALTKALNDSDAGVRAAALRSLGELGREVAAPAIPGVEKLLKDPELDVRVAAVRLLLKFDSDAPAAARALAAELHIPYRRAGGEKSYEPKYNPAVTALTELGEAAVPALINSLKDRDVIVRRNASAILKSIGAGAEIIVPELIVALKDSDPEVRRNAAQAAEKFGLEAKDAGRALLPLLDDADAELRQAAADALVAVGFDLNQAGAAFNTAVYDNFIRRTLGDNPGKIAFEAYLFQAGRDYDPDAYAACCRMMVPGAPELPRLPWPPPRYADWHVLPRKSLGTDANTLADVNERMTGALRSAGYDTTALFIAPGGYAIATKVERIYEDGTSYPLPHRWTKGKIRPGSVKDYLYAFFMEKPGQFRMFIFIITTLDSVQSDGSVLAEDEAWGLFRQGGGVLPLSLRKTPFRGRNCHVIIYRFQKKFGQGATVEYNDPLGLSSQTHLRGSGLLRILGL